MSTETLVRCTEPIVRVEASCVITLCNDLAEYMTHEVNRLIDAGYKSFSDCCVRIFEEGLDFLVCLRLHEGDDAVCEAMASVFRYEAERPANLQPPFEFSFVIEIESRKAREFLKLCEIFKSQFAADEIDPVSMIFDLALTRRHYLAHSAKRRDNIPEFIKFNQSELTVIWRKCSFKPTLYTLH